MLAPLFRTIAASTLSRRPAATLKQSVPIATRALRSLDRGEDAGNFDRPSFSFEDRAYRKLAVFHTGGPEPGHEMSRWPCFAQANICDAACNAGRSGAGNFHTLEHTGAAIHRLERGWRREESRALCFAGVPLVFQGRLKTHRQRAKRGLAFASAHQLHVPDYGALRSGSSAAARDGHRCRQKERRAYETPHGSARGKARWVESHHSNVAKGLGGGRQRQQLLAFNEH